MTTSVAPVATDADTAALDAITARNAEMVGTVIAHATALLDASSAGSLEGASSARRDLVLYARAEVLPSAIAEEDTIYALARRLPETRALVDVMIADHRAMAELIDDLAGATTPLGASAAGHALRVLVELHVEKAGEFVYPVLAASDEVSLADGLTQYTALADELAAASSGGGCGGSCGCGNGGGGCGGGAQESAGGCGCGNGGGGCGCGGHDEAPAETNVESAGGCGCGNGGCGGGATAASEPAAASRPVLDARQVPHNIRHATVFGALDAVRPGSGIELIAPHDPLPLLAQIDEREPGAFAVTYLERGPEVWRIALDRTA